MQRTEQRVPVGKILVKRTHTDTGAFGDPVRAGTIIAFIDQNKRRGVDAHRRKRARLTRCLAVMPVIARHVLCAPALDVLRRVYGRATEAVFRYLGGWRVAATKNAPATQGRFENISFGSSEGY